MNHLEKGLKKASEVINESGEESPNSDKENTISSAGGSSVRQFYGNKSNRTSFDTCTKSPPLLPSMSRCQSDPFHDLSSTSLNIGSSGTVGKVKTYRRNKERPFQSSTSTANISHEPFPTAAVPSHKIGFPNAGMTCYLNAVLQTLLGSKFFSSALLKCKNLVESSSNVHGELFNVFINVAKNKENGHQELVRQSLFQLRQSLRQILPQFADASMQDAHEFLVKFFEVFGDTLKENGMTNKCPFSQTFEYQMSEKKQCLKCNHSTTKFKTEWVLRLDMPPDNSSSKEFVKRSIQNLMERTLLGTMEMRCVNCNNLCTLHQSTEKFSKLPPILIVYLPRSFFINERNSRKNRTLILTNVVLKLPDQVTSDVDCSKLSKVLPSSKETLVITPSKKKRSQIESLFDSSPETTPEKKSKLSFSDKDLNNLSEEEQVKLAMQKSLCESTQIDEEDNRLLAKVIEESLKGVEQEESVLLDEDVRDIIDIKGETVASGEYDYQLTATICHINRSSTSVDMGHYIADVFNRELKQWFRCNDMRVFPTLLQSVVQQSTYDGTILFYTHRNFLEM